ncbi:MAG: hypothetical protein OIF55_10245, partial [Amphritea sp.]|nr:hypothetical protein [Amphritea sp.]
MPDSRYEECEELGNSFTNGGNDYKLSPNQSTGFSPFFLNYGYEPVMPIQLLKGDESTKMESVASFVQRVTSDWNLARENLQRSVGLQQKYYDQKHRDIHYNVGDLVLLSTRGGQIIRSWRGLRPQCVADEDQCRRGAARAAKVPKHRKRVKNADNAENTRTAQETRASAAELSP